MKEFDDFLTILIEKCAEYIWQHNQYIKQLKIIRNVYFYQIFIAINVSGFFLLLLNPITLNMKIILGMLNIYAGFLFILYHLKNYDGIYEQHRISRSRFNILYNDLFQHLNVFMHREIQFDFLLLKQTEFKNIIEQSPHIQQEIHNKFKKKFKHLIHSKPYFQTKRICLCTE